jgi:hypothetical protein
MTTNGRYTTNGRHTAPTARNVLGGPLATCSTAPLTGFYRTGVRKRKAQSAERKTAGQSSARDSCSTALRFALKRLREAGVAPPVVLAATHEAALEVVRREDLLCHAVDVAGGAV